MYNLVRALKCLNVNHRNNLLPGLTVYLFECAVKDSINMIPTLYQDKIIINVTERAKGTFYPISTGNASPIAIIRP